MSNPNRKFKIWGNQSQSQTLSDIQETLAIAQNDLRVQQKQLNNTRAKILLALSGVKHLTESSDHQE